MDCGDADLEARRRDLQSIEEIKMTLYLPLVLLYLCRLSLAADVYLGFTEYKYENWSIVFHNPTRIVFPVLPFIWVDGAIPMRIELKSSSDAGMRYPRIIELPDTFHSYLPPQGGRDSDRYGPRTQLMIRVGQCKSNYETADAMMEAIAKVWLPFPYYRAGPPLNASRELVHSRNWRNNPEWQMNNEFNFVTAMLDEIIIGGHPLVPLTPYGESWKEIFNDGQAFLWGVPTVYHDPMTELHRVTIFPRASSGINTCYEMNEPGSADSDRKSWHVEATVTREKNYFLFEAGYLPTDPGLPESFNPAGNPIGAATRPWPRTIFQLRDRRVPLRAYQIEDRAKHQKEAAQRTKSN
ncbi:MAG: hypothetical protein M1825_005100 [Sarcosagium campestre]|nr:MAG: hypothetical protein M1825_005100 [Sarcosagium campestre]